MGVDVPIPLHILAKFTRRCKGLFYGFLGLFRSEFDCAMQIESNRPEKFFWSEMDALKSKNSRRKLCIKRLYITYEPNALLRREAGHNTLGF